MEIILEWEGVLGIIKILILFSIIFMSGFIAGRKTKR